MALAACTAIKLANAQKQPAGVTCDAALALVLRPSQLTLTDVVMSAEATAAAARRSAAEKAAAAAARLLAGKVLPQLKDEDVSDTGGKAGLTAWLLDGSRLVGETCTKPPHGCAPFRLVEATQRALLEAVKPYLGPGFKAEWETRPFPGLGYQCSISALRITRA
ncbi:hypothetical protein HYH03_013307 [Edaphochlamys debaryana]|uniref:Uncharacterized protein n=1 Tax=Edaphochlamys debaryana TaxID=47281 RepID=A0A835XYV0_9CHLO|nr:hypothetical protein HYH03_013307 [Edaphochlamys debaryana]|eukprot:KAG2488164.1 hypothetical protein HYH03_013307 [Edaphochlamys debaryana]